MLNLIQKDKLLGKLVYFNIIFTQNLDLSYADMSAASADYFMSGADLTLTLNTEYLLYILKNMIIFY
jgi:hypothetical protein